MRKLILLPLAAVALIVGTRYGSDVASGADSYGYITHAEMLAAGQSPFRRARSGALSAAYCRLSLRLPK